MFKMLGGDDFVTFDNANGPITVLGNVSIDGGDGANNVTVTDLAIRRNLSVTNGTAAVGTNYDLSRNFFVRRERDP